MKEWTVTGYKYTGQVYREISMENSDYGGMENVGNTTIISSRIAPDDELVDGGYIYMEGVKVHEYYHNINGSQVTGQSPFEIWLNEAVTVHIQRQREDELFGADFMRLREVLYSFKPSSGPLAEDSSPIAMPVEPHGFNRTQELISSMTYSKAPEVVRMVELMIGQAVFNRGLHLYHTRFAFANATTDDWVACMQEASGVPLKRMADGWLKRSGYPHVTYSTSYNSVDKTYTVTMKQTPVPALPEGAVFDPWVIPVQYALVNDGKDTHTGVYVLSDAEAEFVVADVTGAPDFLSFARGWSFFGTCQPADSNKGLLVAQALSDPDVINRYFAFRSVANEEKLAVLRACASCACAGGDGVTGVALSVSAEYTALFARVLFDDDVTPSTRALVVAESDALAGTHPTLSYRYWHLAAARTALLQAVFDAHGDAIVALFRKMCAACKPGPHLEQLHDRALKHCLAGVLVAGLFKPSVAAGRAPPSPKLAAEVQALLLTLLSSPFMSDAAFGLSVCLEVQLDAVKQQELLLVMQEKWRSHPTTLETFLGVVSGVDSEFTADVIQDLVFTDAPSPLFNINLAGHARSVARSWSSLRKRSLLTDAGLALTCRLILAIGRVNQMSAQALLAAFGDIDLFPEEGEGVLARGRLVAALEGVRDKLDAVAQQSLFNNISTLLHKH